jgi:hypothetical protein
MKQVKVAAMVVLAGLAFVAVQQASVRGLDYTTGNYQQREWEARDEKIIEAKIAAWERGESLCTILPATLPSQQD